MHLFLPDTDATEALAAAKAELKAAADALAAAKTAETKVSTLTGLRIC